MKANFRFQLPCPHRNHNLLNSHVCPRLGEGLLSRQSVIFLCGTNISTTVALSICKQEVDQTFDVFYSLKLNYRPQKHVNRAVHPPTDIFLSLMMYSSTCAAGAASELTHIQQIQKEKKMQHCKNQHSFKLQSYRTACMANVTHKSAHRLITHSSILKSHQFCMHVNSGRG